MTTQTEALKLALEALEKALRYHGMMLLSDPPQDAWKYHRVEQTADEAINAIKEALAQPAVPQGHEQEPETLNYTVHVECKRCGSHERYDLEIDNPQRTWVGLTDDEIAKEVEAELTHYWNGEYIDTTGARDQLTAFARAIEAKLKEKNA